MRIGILGGTFDPIHNGHIALARAAQRQLKLDAIYFLLSPRSPFKLQEHLTPAPLRLSMLRLALRGRPGFRIATWELKRRGPSYMATTLTAYKKAHPRDQVFLVLGSDAFAGFARWKNPEKILKLATLVVGRRPGSDLPDCVPCVAILKGIFPNVSSTSLRDACARKTPKKAAVPPSVRSFLLRRKLYSSSHVR